MGGAAARTRRELSQAHGLPYDPVMAHEIINGNGYRNGVHFRTRALRLGYGVESNVPELWNVTQNGQPVVENLTWGEVHNWLDEQAAQTDQ